MPYGNKSQTLQTRLQKTTNQFEHREPHEIVGTNSSSANTNFYVDYSNSDFLENFLGIKKESLMDAKEIQLNCKAAIKYNPYKGFYPAERTVDLSAQFMDSFRNSIQVGQSGTAAGMNVYTNKSRVAGEKFAAAKYIMITGDKKLTT